VNGVRLRIMQPNLQQDDKFNYSAKADVMSRYLRLSDRATSPSSNGIRDVTHLIWPEAAFPFFLTREPDALAQIAGLIRPSTVLITGAVRAASDANPRDQRAYNSIYVIDPNGSIRGIYDKVHLVPFGEYLPFQRVLERLGLMQLTKVIGGFLSGDRRRPMDILGAPKMLPLVCYEAIFPGAAVPPGERPGWMVNVTNDGWFGISSGPVSAFPAGTCPCDRRRAALGTCSQHRHFGGGRPRRARHQFTALGNRRRAGLPATGCDRTDTLREVRQLSPGFRLVTQSACCRASGDFARRLRNCSQHYASCCMKIRQQNRH
jgi:hypothetical protein